MRKRILITRQWVRESSWRVAAKQAVRAGLPFTFIATRVTVGA